MRKNRILAVGFSVVLAVGTVAFAQEPPATGEGPKLPTPVMSGFGDIRLNGLLQGWYIHDEGADPEGTFRLRRAEIKLSGEITPKVAWWLMFDPAQVREDDTRATVIDDESLLTSAGRKSILQDFAIRLKPAGVLMIDVGQYKVPFGMEGLKSSARLDFIERATLTTQFKWADARDIGVTLRGDLNLGGMNIQPAVGFYNGEGQNRLDRNNGKMIVGRLAVRPVSGLHLGVAHAGNEAGASEVTSRRTGFEAKYATDRFSLYGEYAFGESDGKDKETYYITATAYVSDTLQLAVRYDWFDPDTDMRKNTGTETTLGVNYFIAKHNAKVQANYVFRGEEGPSIDNDIVRMNLQVAF